MAQKHDQTCNCNACTEYAEQMLGADYINWANKEHAAQPAQPAQPQRKPKTKTIKMTIRVKIDLAAYAEEYGVDLDQAAADAADRYGSYAENYIEQTCENLGILARK